MQFLSTKKHHRFLPAVLLKAVIVISLLCSNNGVVTAKPMDSCSRQESCITVTQTEKTEAVLCGNGQCEYEVCLTLTMQGNQCPSSISHICEKSDSICQSTVPLGFVDAAEKAGIPAQYKQCQTAGPNTTLEFLLKDGSGCDGSGQVVVTGTGTIDTPAECAPRTADTSTCTGNGVGKECIWTYTTPACPGGGGTTTTTSPTLDPTATITTSPTIATTAPTVATTAPTVATTAPTVATTAPIVTTTAPTRGAATTSTGAPVASIVNPDISVEKTVTLGGRTGNSCNPGLETVSSSKDSPVTFTYVVLNGGTTCLDNVVLRDDGLKFSVAFPGIMPVGTEYRRCFQTVIEGDQTSDAYVFGNPVDCQTGADLPNLPTVDDYDAAGVKMIGETNTCSTEREVTELPDGQYLITTTETCRQCDCPKE